MTWGRCTLISATDASTEGGARGKWCGGENGWQVEAEVKTSSFESSYSNYTATHRYPFEGFTSVSVNRPDNGLGFLQHLLMALDDIYSAQAVAT